jgi:hypothetical protein
MSDAKIKWTYFPSWALLLIIILQGIIASQKYWATSMFMNEIPMDVKNIIGGVIDCKKINFFNAGLRSLSIDLVFTADIHIIVSIEPASTKIISKRIKAMWREP